MDTQVKIPAVRTKVRDADSARRDFWLAFMCLPHREPVVAALRPMVNDPRSRVSVHAMVSDRLSPPIDTRPEGWDWRKLPPAPRPAAIEPKVLGMTPEDLDRLRPAFTKSEPEGVR